MLRWLMFASPAESDRIKSSIEDFLHGRPIAMDNQTPIFERLNEAQPKRSATAIARS